MKLDRKNICNNILQLLPYVIVKNSMNIDNEVMVGSNIPPELYNDKGEKVYFFFLRDHESLPYSISSGRCPKRIVWDRNNISLDTHFYAHKAMFEKTYECQKKMGMLRESEEIATESFELAMKHGDVFRSFYKVFTHSERLLDKYDNALFMPACFVWYGTEKHGGNMSADQMEKKTKNVSMISSNKSMCELHRIRAELARHFAADISVDTYGAAVNNILTHKADALEEYRYSIVIENSITPYYFTEKILDCFASMTIPIYLGATKIGQFFNEDGIIRISEDDLKNGFDKIDSLVKQCNTSDYEARKNAILDNYFRVQRFLCYEDYLIENYASILV